MKQYSLFSDVGGELCIQTVETAVQKAVNIGKNGRNDYVLITVHLNYIDPLGIFDSIKKRDLQDIEDKITAISLKGVPIIHLLDSIEFSGNGKRKSRAISIIPETKEEKTIEIPTYPGDGQLPVCSLCKYESWKSCENVGKIKEINYEDEVKKILEVIGAKKILFTGYEYAIPSIFFEEPCGCAHGILRYLNNFDYEIFFLSDCCFGKYPTVDFKSPLREIIKDFFRDRRVCTEISQEHFREWYKNVKKTSYEEIMTLLG